MHARILALYRALIALRRDAPDLTDPAFGSLEADADEDTRLFRLRRGGTLIVVNFSAETGRMPVPPSSTVLLATHDGFTLDSDSDRSAAGHDAVLPARSAVVLDLR